MEINSNVASKSCRTLRIAQGCDGNTRWGRGANCAIIIVQHPRQQFWLVKSMVSCLVTTDDIAGRRAFRRIDFSVLNISPDAYEQSDAFFGRMLHHWSARQHQGMCERVLSENRRRKRPDAARTTSTISSAGVSCPTPSPAVFKAFYSMLLWVRTNPQPFRPHRISPAIRCHCVYQPRSSRVRAATVRGRCGRWWPRRERECLNQRRQLTYWSQFHVQPILPHFQNTCICLRHLDVIVRRDRPLCALLTYPPSWPEGATRTASPAAERHPSSRREEACETAARPGGSGAVSRRSAALSHRCVPLQVAGHVPLAGHADAKVRGGTEGGARAVRAPEASGGGPSRARERGAEGGGETAAPSRGEEQEVRIACSVFILQNLCGSFCAAVFLF